MRLLLIFKKGDIIGKISLENDRCILWNGDCLDLMNKIPNKSIDMILCDLPYGTTVCKWDTVIPYEKLWENYERVIKENGAIVLFGAEPFSSKLRLSNESQYKYDWIWIKPSVVGFANAKKMPLKNVEYISVFYKKLPTYNPQGLIKTEPKLHKNGSCLQNRQEEKSLATLNGGRFKEDYISEFTNYPRQTLTFSREVGLHPTQKPVPLLEYMIRTYTNEGETVLDNCMGSGSTGVAALNANRRFIGIELNATYCGIAKQRIQDIDA